MMGRGSWFLVGAFALGALALVVLTITDAPPGGRTSASPPVDSVNHPVSPPSRTDVPPNAGPVARAPSVPPPTAPLQAPAAPPENLTGLAGYPASGRYGEQAQLDRKRLGDAAYNDMERLWARGNAGRGSPDAQAAMEDLLNRYPDTHRAGCAAIELAVHRLKDTRKSQKERVEGAEDLLKRARDRYAESRCNGDVKAQYAAQMHLAVEVYRFTDGRLARSMLGELAELPPTELDTRGRPLSERAKTLLAATPGTMPAMDDKKPPGAQ